MIIRAYRDAVVAAIKAGIADFRDVKAHGGTFTEAQLKHYAVKAPCCLVAFLGIKKNGTASTGESKGPGMFAAYVIADDKGKVESFDVALDLAEKVAGFLHGNSFGQNAGMALVDGIENLFTLGSEKQGSTIAAVTFAVDLRFGVNSYLQNDPAPGGLTLSQMNILGLGGEEATLSSGD